MKEVVELLNIPRIFITLDTFHLLPDVLRGWLKEVAFQNIAFISVTLDTFQ